MKRETVHIISHSHWDREWYLPFEEHRMRLVELIDDLIELFEQDSDFKSFHLDGQTIVLEDYLAIRPQNKDKLEELIKTGKLVIGPFYILQDDFLISSEANTRNTLIGHLESQKWGKAPKIGYFPDTFGHAGQIPQLLRQSNIDVALFGRGVKPVGFDNQVFDHQVYQSQYSEMIWEGADGSQVLGILFANWYSNGNEIPVDREEALLFWDKRLADVRRYASTSHYLLMNGCDHQPVQKNLSEALAVARDLYPDIDFIHSDFEAYIQAVKADLPEELSVVKGELTSQETDGWYGLANTASSRIYLKQKNNEASKYLEQVVEPLAILTRQPYPQDELTYAWKLLLQNSPHDSICGCSIDDVHQEMELRFAKVLQVGRYLANHSFDNWAKSLATSHLEGYLITVFNTTGHCKTGRISVEVTLDVSDFRDGCLKRHYDKVDQVLVPNLRLFDSRGRAVDAEIEDLGASFDYKLPKDAFRSAMFARKVRVTFVVENQSAFSWETYQLKAIDSPYLKPVDSSQTFKKTREPRLENSAVTFWQENGHLYFKDKETGHSLEDFLVFEDVGDIGNEYAHFAPKNSQPIYSRLVDCQVTKMTSDWQQAKAIHCLELPISAAETLRDEQIRLVEYYRRQTNRHEKTRQLYITTEFNLYGESGQLEIRTSFVNDVKDHRLRVLIKSGLTSLKHQADSIYETVTRSNQPSDCWQNPHHPQRHRSFINLEEARIGLTVSSQGLHEYEILDNSCIALTLLRSIGELGDWGDFPTPEAQCLREINVIYAIEVHRQADYYGAIHRAKSLQVPFFAKQVEHEKGVIPPTGGLNHPVLHQERVCVTALKKAEQNDAILLRYYHLSADDLNMQHDAKGVNLLEDEIGLLPRILKGQEIRTEILEDLMAKKGE